MFARKRVPISLPSTIFANAASGLPFNLSSFLADSNWTAVSLATTSAGTSSFEMYVEKGVYELDWCNFEDKNIYNWET